MTTAVFDNKSVLLNLRIILYCKYAAVHGYKYVRVKSPDSDVFFLLLHYASTMKEITIIFDTGTGNKKKIINVTEISKRRDDVSVQAMLALQAFTGCDTTSCFKGIGKLKPLKLLKKFPEYYRKLAMLGELWEVPFHLLDDLD